MPAAAAAQDRDAGWRDLAEEVLIGFRAWQEAHPAASLTEIEADLAARLDRLRARLGEDAALRGAVVGLGRPAARPACPSCGAPTRADGQEVRWLTAAGDQVLTLRRSRSRCPACGAGLVPPR